MEELIAWAEDHARELYDGVQVRHRSCGIAIAETFGRATPAYQALRRGGITGCGECGAIKAGELVIGEILGDPDPTGAVTTALREGLLRYRELWQAETGLRDSSIVCNDLTSQFLSFQSSERHAYCTELAAVTSRCVARALLEQGIEINPLDLPSS